MDEESRLKEQLATDVRPEERFHNNKSLEI